MVVQDGERWEIGTVSMLAARGNAEFLACCSDLRKRNPGGLVRVTSKIKSVALATISHNRRYGERRIVWHTALSMGLERRAGQVALRRYHLRRIREPLL